MSDLEKGVRSKSDGPCAQTNLYAQASISVIAFMYDA